MDTIILNIQNGIATVTLNRPEARNALSLALQKEITSVFSRLSNDSAVHAVILTGSGNKAFCAGLDLKELKSGTNLLTLDFDPVEAVYTCKKPVIAAINGAAITGGLELALACDILIASETAVFADTHVKMNVIPGWGLSQRLSRTIGIRRAKEMSLSATSIDAETALAWGLVNHIYPPQDLMKGAQKLAQSISAHDPHITRGYRDLINKGHSVTLNKAMKLEAATAAQHNSTLNPAALTKQSQQEAKLKQQEIEDY